MRVALGVEYDGCSFNGWQSQANGRTVQDTLQNALGLISGEAVSITAAGRTDAGVHALEQVIHFDTEVHRPLTAWVRGANTLLPDSVAVLWAHPVPDGFHARFSAQGRSYRYVLINRSTRLAVHTGKAGWYHSPLDIAAMQEAAQFLTGKHDFSAFRAAQCQAKSPVKNLYQLDIHSEGEMIVFDLSADAFLHHMVRNMAGTLLEVGRGSILPDEFLELFTRRDRNLAGFTAPAHGLVLVKVRY